MHHISRLMTRNACCLPCNHLLKITFYTIVLSRGLLFVVGEYSCVEKHKVLTFFANFAVEKANGRWLMAENRKE